MQLAAFGTWRRTFEVCRKSMASDCIFMYFKSASFSSGLKSAVAFCATDKLTYIVRSYMWCYNAKLDEAI